MRITLAVRGPQEDALAATSDLRRWLHRHPDLRGSLQREQAPSPAAGTMGASGELVALLLAPGGATAALAAAVVAWLQNRRGTQTVTITLPDGTQTTVTSERVRGLTAGDAGELARRIAATLQQPEATGDPAHHPGNPDRDPDGRPTDAGGAARPTTDPDLG